MNEDTKIQELIEEVEDFIESRLEIPEKQRFGYLLGMCWRLQQRITELEERVKEIDGKDATKLRAELERRFKER